ncbi:Trypanosome basal body component protein [Novymonas esmeraldas]|uniref:Trypanosome basal body component protein n=1 Tax=Novymonas esmeraldas TaxID=1808958 RepID=A0AAW0ETI2_9TRYP
MISDEAPTSAAVTGGHVDQLLEEYLRVINDKDDRIHRLLRQLQENETAAAKRDKTSAAKQQQLSEQLRGTAKKLKETQAQLEQEEQSTRALVFNCEALKRQLQESDERSAAQVAAATEAAARHARLERELSDVSATLAALRVENTACSEERAAAQHLAALQSTTVADLKAELGSATRSLEEARALSHELQSKMQEMMPHREHVSTVAALEAKWESERTQRATEVERLREALSGGELSHRATQHALRKAQQDVEELTALLQAATKGHEAAKQQLATTAATALQTDKELREEAARCRRASAASAERVDELERSLERAQDALHRTAAELQAVSLQHERLKAATEAAQAAAQEQLRSQHAQLQQGRDDAERARRLLDAKERAVGDGAEALIRAREEANRVQADARERLATATAAAAARAEECARVQQQLSRAQADLAEAQRRTAAEERSMGQKLEELQAGVQRLHGQLRDREEEARRTELVHSKEMQKAQHEHALAVEDTRRRHEGEVRELQARLELARAELSERAGGSKGLEKELHHVAEVRQEMRGEVQKLLGTLEAKEAAIDGLRREIERRQAEVAQLTQRLAEHERGESTWRQRLEEAERVRLDSIAASDRAAEALATMRAAAEKSAAAVAAVEARLSAKESAIAALRRDVEECAEAKQLAFKEVMVERAHRDKLALSLAAAEERVGKAELELRAAVQEQQRLRRAVEDGAEEARRLRADAEQRDAECARLTRHAADVESLARHTAEELRQTIQERDETIQRLRAEQATVLPHLNEERSKSLVLQERLQHQQEMSRTHMDQAEQRIRALEAAATGCEAELAALQSEKRRAEEQLLESHAEVAALTGTLDSREQKYQQRKEETRKSLQQAEEARAAAADALQRAEAQTAAADTIRAKYKHEKAKMESLLQRMEERVRESARREKEDHERAEDTAARLAEAEEALRRANEALDSRVSEVKARYEEVCRQQEESCRAAASDVSAAEQLARSLQAQLHEAQRRAVSAESSRRDLQRHVAVARAVALEDYAEEAIDMKRACMDLVLRAHRSSVARTVSATRDGWSVATTAAAVLHDGVRDAERHLARVHQEHQSEMRAMQEAHQRRLEAAAAEHREAVARLQRELAEAERRADAAKRCDGDRDDRARAAQDSLERVTAQLEAEKRQTALLRDRVAAEEARRSSDARGAEEARHGLQRSHDKLKRQLDDRVAEQKHSEDELRELRAEVAALQRVLAEREREAKQVVDQRAGQEQERLVSAVAAREAAEQRCGELHKQLNFMRGQLETARLSHERVVSEHQATQRARDTRLDAAHAELATAVAERRRFQREAEGLEERVRELTKEVQMLRRQEADVLGQLQARKAELSALRERCANVESLKCISEASLAETQARERDLMEKIEELRSAQHLMQLCFDKQQEQLEVGRRLRQQDTLHRARRSP